MVEVFKTNVGCREMAEQVVSTLLTRFPYFKVTFDLDDCDKILRVEGSNICIQVIVELVTKRGFQCEVLD
jgi:hypothetical protein